MGFGGGGGGSGGYTYSGEDANSKAGDFFMTDGSNGASSRLRPYIAEGLISKFGAGSYGSTAGTTKDGRVFTGSHVGAGDSDALTKYSQAKAHMYGTDAETLANAIRELAEAEAGSNEPVASSPIPNRKDQILSLEQSDDEEPKTLLGE